EAGVDRLAVDGLREVVGDERVGRLEGALAFELDFSHVRDVEEAGGGTHRFVLGDDARVLNGQLPAREVDHAAVQLLVRSEERSLPGHSSAPYSAASVM